MAKARHGHAERKPPGRVRSPENSSRARERIAAQRAARRRAEVRRRILVAIASSRLSSLSSRGWSRSS